MTRMHMDKFCHEHSTATCYITQTPVSISNIVTAEHIRTWVPEACIKDRDMQLYPTYTVGCNNLSLPLIPASGPYLTTAIWRRRNRFSQWQRNFQRKLCFHWLKLLRQCHVAVVRQGPGTQVLIWRRLVKLRSNSLLCASLVRWDQFGRYRG